ncbi:hydrolase 1, exosortase A system-associated [Rhodocyclus tenuis]|uniref:hydrolase 1, exosortase A system-associated n=1 Tax=Rhodocyclus tenuis TaxID=1066 RepID=UPI001905EEB0|nr:hydrolase 1, exosortase A system-associated [Rhodocyclus tenuis]
MNEQPLVFESGGLPLPGMLHPAAGPARLGVLMMVAGGPQYRIGGHRQLLLWARDFAAAGFPALRFDFAGMGDSYGDYRGFEHVDEDIRAALDAFFAAVPSLQGVVLWGECNACSASLFYAHRDPRVRGLVMLNPWVRTKEGEARTVVRHYYLERLRQPSFWKKIFSLQFDWLGSARSAAQMLSRASGAPATDAGTSATPQRLPDRMLAGLRRFHGPIMLVMSGRDWVAKEFDDLLKSDAAWQAELLPRLTQRHDLPYADHTFSSGEWRDQVAGWGLQWLAEVDAGKPKNAPGGA